MFVYIFVAYLRIFYLTEFNLQMIFILLLLFYIVYYFYSYLGKLKFEINE